MVDLNLLYISQLKHFLSEISDELFLNTSSKHHFSGSIAAHSRHIIEFYIQFINALNAGTIDYDARMRNKEIESDKTFAIAELNHLSSSFTQLISYKNISLISRHNGQEYMTSFGRELSYLAEHTIHHFAFIRLIAESENFDFVHLPGFGIAQSTLNFRTSQQN